MGGNMWLGIIVLLAGSVMALYGFIVSKKPEAKEMLDKIVPFQGIIGIILLIWGIIDLIRSLEWWGVLLEYSFFDGIILIAYIVVCISLGLLLGYSLIAKFVLGKNEGAMEKGNAMVAKLAKIQNPLGILGIIIAILLIIRF